MAKVGRSFLLVILMFEGLVAGGMCQDCNLMQNCEALSPLNNLTKRLPFSENELNSVCPQILQYTQCLLEEIGNCTGQDIFERTSTSNQAIPVYAIILLDLKDLILDTCNPNSTLYQGYLSNIECFSTSLNQSDLRQHRYDGLVVYDAYRQTRELLRERRDPNERQCMATAYAVGAFSTRLRKNCGVEGNAIFLEILKRLRKLLRNFSKCTNTHVILLRTKYMSFLDFLGLEERQMKMFSAVFRVMR